MTGKKKATISIQDLLVSLQLLVLEVTWPVSGEGQSLNCIKGESHSNEKKREIWINRPFHRKAPFLTLLSYYF